MSGLRSGLEELSGEELAIVDDRQLHADVLELASVEELIRAERLRRLAEIDRRGSVGEQGYVSTAAWLRDKARWDSRAAHREVGTARALEGMPLTAAAHHEGAIGPSQLRVLVRAARDHSEAYRDAEETLVSAAQALSSRQLARLVDYWAQNLDPDAAVDAEQALHERRRIHLSATYEGLVRLDGWLDREGGATVMSALGAHTDAGVRDPSEDRTPAQLRADALVEICRDHLDHGRLPASGGERPHVSLTVDLAALEDRTGTPCEVDGSGVVTPAAALRLACDAGISRVITRGPSEPLDVGRRTRTIPPALRRALVVRDGGCRYPGCERPQRWCDGHHIQHWIRGGRTNLDNLVLLCRRHHRRVHEHGETITLKGTEVLVGRGPP